MKAQLFPRLPRRMKQPAKEVLRDQLALAAIRIEELLAENARLRATNPRRGWRLVRRPHISR